LIQLSGELGPFDGWHFDIRGRNEIAHNFEGIVKLVDFLGEVAKAKQIEGGHVLEESHTVDRFPFDHPGLFNDPLDLIFGTDSCGHSDNVDRDLQRMSSCCGPARFAVSVARGTRCARWPLTRANHHQLGLGSSQENSVRVPALADDEPKTYFAFQSC